MRVFRHKDGRFVVPDFFDVEIYEKAHWVHDNYGSTGYPSKFTITYRHLYGEKLGEFKFKCLFGTFYQQYTEVSSKERTPLWKVLNGE